MPKTGRGSDTNQQVVDTHTLPAESKNVVVRASVARHPDTPPGVEARVHRTICRSCDGSGELDFDHPCPGCGGTGKVEDHAKAVEAPYEALADADGPRNEGVRCPGCSGDGDDPWIEGGDCPLCAGTGEVTGARLEGIARHLSEGSPALNAKWHHAEAAERENKRHAVVIRAAYAVLNDYADGAESHYAQPGSSRCHCCGRKWPCNWHRLSESLRRVRPVAPVNGC
jgi:hypothetical protein